MGIDNGPDWDRMTRDSFKRMQQYQKDALKKKQIESNQYSGGRGVTSVKELFYFDFGLADSLGNILGKIFYMMTGVGIYVPMVEFAEKAPFIGFIVYFLVLPVFMVILIALSKFFDSPNCQFLMHTFVSGFFLWWYYLFRVMYFLMLPFFCLITGCRTIVNAKNNNIIVKGLKYLFSLPLIIAGAFIFLYVLAILVAIVLANIFSYKGLSNLIIPTLDVFEKLWIFVLAELNIASDWVLQFFLAWFK